MYRINRTTAKPCGGTRRPTSTWPRTRNSSMPPTGAADSLMLDRARGTEQANFDTSAYTVPISNELTDRIFLASTDGQLLCLYDRDYPKPLVTKTIPKPLPKPVEKPMAEPRRSPKRRSRQRRTRRRQEDGQEGQGRQKKARIRRRTKKKTRKRTKRRTKRRRRTTDSIRPRRDFEADGLVSRDAESSQRSAAPGWTESSPPAHRAPCEDSASRLTD